MEKRCYGCMKRKTQSPVCEHCGFLEGAQNQPHQLPIGHLLQGRYLIGRVLGQGGFGITYLGYDEKLDIPVAVKEFFPTGAVTRDTSHSVVNTTGADSFEKSLDRFLQEARTLAKLMDVPEIVKVLNICEGNGTAYIVMEYLEGLDLRTYLKRMGRLLTPEETLQLLRPVMQGLDKVHNAGLIHRDISPDNIMLQPSGKIKLLDFGTARDTGKLSHSTQVVLKHGFAPMEQYRTNGDLGPWTDVYALCATAYYCMTGSVPPESPERLMDQLPINWEKIPGLSPAWAKVLDQGMAISSKNRIQSVEALENMLFNTHVEEKPKRCHGCMRLKKQSPVCEHCGFSENTPNPINTLPLGYMLHDRYLVGRVLKADQFCNTYMGYDLKQNIPVSIQEYVPSVSSLRNPDNHHFRFTDNVQLKGLKHFVQNATILAGLQHIPEFEKVHNIIRSNGTAYVILEDVEGVTLQEYLKRLQRPLSPDETMNILRPIMQGLKEAHQKGLVHHAISPVSIVLQASSQGKLMSSTFIPGIPTHDDDQMLTWETHFHPIERYIENITLGPQADVYSLCATAYYCMTGHVPKAAPERVIDQIALPWHEIHGLSFGWAKILDKGMAVSVANRIQSVEELERMLFPRTLVLADPPQEPETEKKTEKKDPFKTVPADPEKKKPESVTETQPEEQKKPEPPEKPKKNKLPLIITAVLALIIGVGSFMYMNRSQTIHLQGTTPKTSQTTSPKATTPKATTPKATEPKPQEVWRNNILMSDENKNRTGSSFSPSLRTYPVFGSKISRNQIREINFLSTLKNVPSDAWDVSSKKDGRVKAWVTPSGSFYILYIAADGGVCAPKTSRELFCGYSNLKTINFNGNFHTDTIQSAAWMFYDCSNLTSLNLSQFNTSTITNMNGMFAMCSKLETLDISKFDTANVTDMAGMFYGCSSLIETNLMYIDTSKVVYMNDVFSGCKNLKTVKLGSWEITSVKNYSNFMDSGKKYNDRPWLDLFTKTITSVNWEWADKQYHHGSKKMGYKENTTPVEHCTSLDFYTTATGKNGYDPSGRWNILLRINGVWKQVGFFEVVDGSGKTTLVFDAPITFDGFTAYPVGTGTYSWTCNHNIKNIHILIGE